MKFQVLSDLHLEFFVSKSEKKNFINSLKTDADLILLTGDISVGNNLIDDYNLVADILGKIIFIPGNHEYYYSSRTEVDKLLKSRVNGVFLNNSYIDFNNIRIIGGTGWSSIITDTIISNLNDFRLIKEFKENPFISIIWHNETKKYFENILKQSQNKKIICLTHNAPTLKHIPEKYITSLMNDFFVNNWENMIHEYKPSYWLSGHIHTSSNFKIDKTILIENSFGYFIDDENKNFNKHLTFTIKET